MLRERKGIKVRIISDAEPYDKKANYRLMRGKIKTALWLYNGKIALISPGEEPIGVIRKIFMRVLR